MTPWNENAQAKRKQQTNGNRVIWLVYRTDTNSRCFWLVKRTLGWKSFMPDNFLEINQYFALTSYCNTIGQSNNAFSILGFLGGKTKSPCFDLFIHWPDKTNNEHLPKPFFKVIRKSLYSPIFNLKVEGNIGFAHWVCSSLLSHASPENHVILKGKPLPTLSHLHTEYRKAVLQSATALSKYTGNNMNSHLIVSGKNH